MQQAYAENKVEPLCGRIYAAQQALKEKKQWHNLPGIVSMSDYLAVVQVDDIGISWNKEKLESMYPAINNDYERLVRYASDLESLLKN